MRCLDAAATGRSIGTMFNHQQFLERPRRWANLAGPPPMQNARRAHIEETGGFSLASHQLFAVHAVSLPRWRIDAGPIQKLSPQGGGQVRCTCPEGSAN
jgi:hypothetical protein